MADPNHTTLLLKTLNRIKGIDMKKIIIIGLLLFATIFSSKSLINYASATINPTEGSKVYGKVTFTLLQNGKIKVVADIYNLSPGKHGFHIHEFGDCSDPKGLSAGGHFAGTHNHHAGKEEEMRHSGDLGNLIADEKGFAHLEWTDPNLKFDGENSIIGRGVIVHEKEDDLKTQPTGNAGARLACGTIGIAKQAN